MQFQFRSRLPKDHDRVSPVGPDGVFIRKALAVSLFTATLFACPNLTAQETTDPQTPPPAAAGDSERVADTNGPTNSDSPAPDSEASSPSDQPSAKRETDASVDASKQESSDQGNIRGADVTPDEAANILLDELNRPREAQLRFNFTGASWKDVLEWMATEGEMSLQIDRYPEGSVSFIDKNRTYSVAESLDLLNRLLLDRGYALIRRGRMLFLVDLEMDNADKLISELADFVPISELQYRGKSDIVSTVFPLGSMTPNEAKTQLPEMIGPWGRVIVLESARQAKVTERAGKLLAILDVIEQSDEEVHEIQLEYRSAEELLQTARPLLGLEPTENSNDDIRISVGLYGDRIYATGLRSKVSILESLVKKADKPLEGSGDATEAEVIKPIFQTHFVRTADPATVFEVLQTLLQDEPGTRVAIDPATNALIAFATPTTHQKITDVIAKMEGSGENFEVFQLKRIDPAQALLTINKYFGVTEEGGNGPIVDGDPATGKMWVRGSKDEIEQVRRLIEELDGAGTDGMFSGKVRMLPLSGRQAEEALRQLQMYWRLTGRENSIRVVSPPGASNSNGIRERRIVRPPADQPSPAGESPADPPREADPRKNIDASASRNTKTYYLTQAPAYPSASTDQGRTVNTPAASVPDIMIELTPSGIRIASDDTEALDELEAMLSQLAGPMGAQNDLPTIFWLKYIQADVAAEFIASILGGSDSSAGLADTITGGLGGGMLGGLMGLATGGGGESSSKSVLTSTGSVNIVPDLRLNALFIQANEIDLQVIEMVLEKIDIEESPEDIELTSMPRMIPVLYQSATEIAKVVKEQYAGRIAGSEQGGGGGGGGGRGGGGQPSPQDFINALRGGGRGGRGGGGEAPKSERSKIAISVDEQSNSLIVTATTQDFEEIKLLVEALDQGGKTTVPETVVYPLPGSINGEQIVEALGKILGEQVQTKESGTSSATTDGRPSGNTNSSEAAEAMRQRIEAFRSRFGGGGRGGDTGRGGPGGGAFGGGRGGGGGGPFGGGGGPGGRGGGGGGRGGGGR